MTNPKISLEEMKKCVERELETRSSAYPGLVGRGKITAADAVHEQNTMSALVELLALFVEFESEIRNTLRKCIADRRLKEEARKAPAVQAVFDQFQDDASISEVTLI